MSIQEMRFNKIYTCLLLIKNTYTLRLFFKTVLAKNTVTTSIVWY